MILFFKFLPPLRKNMLACYLDQYNHLPYEKTTILIRPQNIYWSYRIAEQKKCELRFRLRCQSLIKYFVSKNLGFQHMLRQNVIIDYTRSFLKRLFRLTPKMMLLTTDGIYIQKKSVSLTSTTQIVITNMDIS